MKNFLSVLPSTLQGGLRGGLLIFALLATTSLWAYNFQSGDLYYYVSIANRHDVLVTYRNHDTYSDNYYGYEGLTNIIIPETVTNDTITYRVTGISSHAFEDCSSLTSISIPNSVTTIGNSAFYDCSSLESITIPNSVTSIESYTFAGCSSLTSINIPNSVTSIYGRAFENCSSLKSITIPNSVTSIGASAFRSCSSLESITLPNAITSIGEDAFIRCSSLTSITIPESVTSIGEGAFCLCSSLESITLPNAITSIGEAAFYDCSSLTSINIPNSVTSIGANAFYSCSSLNSITIPNSVTSIGGGAFYKCSSLTSATIGNSVTSIGGYAFYNCSSLESIAIPNSVTSIGEYAFYKCSGLTLVTIGDGLTSIGAKAFDYCKNIEEIYCYPITPPAVESSSFCNYSKATLYVPCDSKEVYEQHPIFGKFEKIKGIEGCGEYVTTHIYDTICQGDVYEFGEYLCDTTGTYTAFIDLVPTYLHLTVLPRIIDTITIQVCDSYEWRGKVYTESGVYTYRDPYNPCVIEELHLTIIDTPTPPSEPQDTTIYSPTEGIGVFSIGEGKTVTFSPGNLQYHPATDEWRFAENQTDYIGDANSNCSSTYNGWLDLFGWSMSSTNFGVSTSIEDNDYSGSFVDWGTNKIGNDAPNTWRTLSYDEWYYLRYTRTNADNLVGVAQVNGVNGLIFLPDNWTCPSGVTFKSGFHSNYGVDYYAAYQTFTADQWSKLEAAGAVFLPASGDRIVSRVYDVQNNGYYWSATGGGSHGAYCLYFRSGKACMDPLFRRAVGHSVRLVKDVNSTTPEPPIEPQDTTIYHPVDSVTICENDLPYIWRGMVFTEGGTYTHEEIVEEENYIYHYIFTLELTVLREDPIEYDAEKVTICASELPYFWVVDGEYGPYWVECETAGTYEYIESLECGRAIYTLELEVLEEGIVDTIWVEAYDSYEWHGKVYTESGTYIYENFCSIEVLELTIIDTPTPPEPEIPTEGIGVFSIGEGKTVTFSRGNLQYTQSTDTWSFAENQWDMIGTDNVIGGSVSSDPTYGDSKSGNALADKIDLFGWSTSTTNFGVSTSTSGSDYSGSFVDWGTNQIGADAPNTWRTLTYDEWIYLLRERPNYSELCGVAQVNGVNGLILLPDNWNCPSGVTFKSGFHSNEGVDYYATYQTFTANQWSKLESTGAVFLPTSGYRKGSFVYYVQYYGNFWSATGSDNYYETGCLRFYSYVAPMGYNYRYSGHSVRLVKDINSTTPEPPTQPQDTTIYHPTEYVAICERDVFNWRGMEFTEAGTYTYEEIVEDENYIYHYIYTLVLQVIAPPLPDTIVVEAYDSYEWHGRVYTESGTYTYYDNCSEEILELTIIPSEDKEYVYEHHNYLVCDADIFVDPITGSTHVISSLIPFSLTWSDTIIGTNIDTIHTFNITPIVYPEPLTEDMLYAIGAVPKLVAGEKVDLMGTTELIMAYYQMHDQHDIADVIGVEWVAGHDVVLDAEQTTHTMVLEVWDECDDIIPMEFTFPVSTKDSEPQDTTIYIYYTEDATICEGETYIWWMGKEYTETGTYTYAYEEIVEEDDYIYHYYHIFTLELTVIAPMILVWPVEAYDSYEWHGVVYTESGTYLYEEWCFQEILELTIIPSTETAVDNMQTDSDHSAQKILRDGQLYIYHNGSAYTIMGQKVSENF